MAQNNQGHPNTNVNNQKDQQQKGTNQSSKMNQTGGQQNQGRSNSQRDETAPDVGMDE